MNTIFKKTLLIIFIIIFLLIFSICAYIIIHDFLECKENNQDTLELIEDAIDTNIKGEDNKSDIEKSINWNYLKSVNEDIIAWIEIENTNINYPILKDNNNLYYLKHSYNKKYNSNGSIFTVDAKPFENDETLIYGHNMRNGTMFSILGNYLDRNYLNSHQNIKIYTPFQNYNCQIFSVYSIGIASENNNIKLLEFNDRINYYKNASKYKIEIAEPIHKIIKLSTCSYLNTKKNPTDQRYYIIANLISTK